MLWWSVDMLLNSRYVKGPSLIIIDITSPNLEPISILPYRGESSNSPQMMLFLADSRLTQVFSPNRQHLDLPRENLRILRMADLRAIGTLAEPLTVILSGLDFHFDQLPSLVVKTKLYNINIDIDQPLARRDVVQDA